MGKEKCVYCGKEIKRFIYQGEEKIFSIKTRKNDAIYEIHTCTDINKIMRK